MAKNKKQEQPESDAPEKGAEDNTPQAQTPTNRDRSEDYTLKEVCLDGNPGEHLVFTVSADHYLAGRTLTLPVRFEAE